MLPFASLINIEKDLKTPIYLQIANRMIENIRNGIIPKGTKILGTRVMADTLGVHRKTVVAAYDEMIAQGWLETQASKGTFVSLKIPEVKPISLDKIGLKNDFKTKTGFTFQKSTILNRPVLRGSSILGFDDGSPDVRLAPLDELARAYRSVLKKGYKKEMLFYGDTKGEISLREAMVDYLKDSRGLNVTVDNVMITRGSMMAIYLTVQTVVNMGDNVIVSEIGYGSSNMICKNSGANLLSVGVDENGLKTDEIEELCRKMPIRMVYVTPHHHYPTTVTMSAERRMHLLQLAEKYQFCILEDDYDYDYHYSSSPILPLASVPTLGTEGYVVYVGSLCKTISPALRIGYIVAPTELINEMAQLRRIIDRQGDNILEAAIAELFREGDIKRLLKKAQRAYHKRRDLFCEMLKTEFNDVIHFKKPNGGMAVWAQYDPSVSLPILAEKALKKGLKISDGSTYNPDGIHLNAARMGFAAVNEEEIERGIGILKGVIKA
jgi:GntR family transcriptional regulator / MocR family aminotransferase